MKRILIADDHPVTIDGVATLIDRFPSFEIVKVTQDPIDVLMTEDIDIAILDIDFKHAQSGFDLIKELKDRASPPRILVLSYHDELAYVHRAIDVGADGYLNKSNSDQLKVALCAVASHETYFPDNLKDETTRSTHVVDSDTLDELTMTQFNTLCLIADGYEPDDIADRLAITVKSVHNIRYDISRTLGLDSARQLNRVAHQLLKSGSL